MSTFSKIILIFTTVVIIWGGVFAVLYFSPDSPFNQQASTVVTTSTVDTGLSAEASSYIQYIEQINRIVTETVTKIDVLLSIPQIDNLIWRQQVADNAGIIIAYNSAAAQAPTPNDNMLIQIQTLYLYAMGYYTTAVQTAVEAVNSSNTGALSIAVAYMGSATNSRIQAVSLLNQYKIDHS